jgi:hypothetical protein
VDAPAASIVFFLLHGRSGELNRHRCCANAQLGLNRVAAMVTFQERLADSSSTLSLPTEFT